MHVLAYWLEFYTEHNETSGSLKAPAADTGFLVAQTACLSQLSCTSHGRVRRHGRYQSLPFALLCSLVHHKQQKSSQQDHSQPFRNNIIADDTFRRQSKLDSQAWLLVLNVQLKAWLAEKQTR